MRENSQNFYTVLKIEKFSLTWKIFRQINSLVKPLLSRNFCQKCMRERIPVFNFHTVYTHCGKTRNSLSPNSFFRLINSLVTYLVNLLLSRNFWQKCMREFPYVISKSFAESFWYSFWLNISSKWKNCGTAKQFLMSCRIFMCNR